MMLGFTTLRPDQLDLTSASPRQQHSSLHQPLKDTTALSTPSTHRQNAHPRVRKFQGREAHRTSARPSQITLHPHPLQQPPRTQTNIPSPPTQVPPTFDGVNYDDNKQLKAAQDAIIREQWVQSMMARLIREEMGKCYRREGVNHLEKCGELRG